MKVIFEEESDGKVNDGLRISDLYVEEKFMGKVLVFSTSHETHHLDRSQVEELVAKLLDWLGTTK